MRRLLPALVALITTLLVWGVPAAAGAVAPAPPTARAEYVYEGHQEAGVTPTITYDGTAASGRGAAVNGGAVDPWSEGSTARRDASTTAWVYVYDASADGAVDDGVAGGPRGSVTEVLRPLRISGVAAKSGTELRRVGDVLESVDDVMANPSLHAKRVRSNLGPPIPGPI